MIGLSQYIMIPLAAKMGLSQYIMLALIAIAIVCLGYFYGKWQEAKKKKD